MRNERLKTRTGALQPSFWNVCKGYRAEILSSSSSAKWLIKIHLYTKLGGVWDSDFQQQVRSKRTQLWWIQSAVGITYGQWCKPREGREYGIPVATSTSQLCSALGSQALLALNLLCSCGPPPAVLVHLVLAAVGCDGEEGQSHSMYLPHAKKLFPNIWVASTTSSCHIFQTSSSPVCLCFTLQALWYTLQISCWNHCFQYQRTSLCFRWRSRLPRNNFCSSNQSLE